MGVTEQQPDAGGARGHRSSGEHHLSAPIVPTAFTTYENEEMVLQGTCGTDQVFSQQVATNTQGHGGGGGLQYWAVHGEPAVE